MESPWKLIVLLLWIFLFSNGCLSEKRFISRLRNVQQHLQNQIDNLRTELKTEINMLRGDIKMLFDVEAEGTTVGPEVVKNVNEQGTKHDEGKAAPYVQMMVKAFGIEKKLNRKVRDELSALKETMTHEIENQKIAYERSVAKVSAGVKEDIETWKEIATSVILKKSINIESSLSNLYKKVQNSIKRFEADQEGEFDNITAAIKANVEASKSELNQRIQIVQAGMQDDINKLCVIPLASTNASLTSVQSVIEDLSAKIDKDPGQIQIPICNQGVGTRLYSIYLEDADEVVPINCYDKKDGGAWASIYQWDYSAESDFKFEEEYRKGFGRFGDNYWFGFKHLTTLTINKGLQLRIEMTDIDGNENVGTFEDFKVVKEGRNYRVNFGKFNGSLPHKHCFESDAIPALFGNAMRNKDWIPLTNCFVRLVSIRYFREVMSSKGAVLDVTNIKIYLR